MGGLPEQGPQGQDNGEERSGKGRPTGRHSRKRPTGVTQQDQGGRATPPRCLGRKTLFLAVLRRLRVRAGQGCDQAIHLCRGGLRAGQTDPETVAESWLPRHGGRARTLRGGHAPPSCRSSLPRRWPSSMAQRDRVDPSREPRFVRRRAKRPSRLRNPVQSPSRNFRPRLDLLRRVLRRTVSWRRRRSLGCSSVTPACPSTTRKRSRQRDALTAAGCARIFEDTASGKTTDRRQLTAVLDYARPGDVLCVEA